MGLKNTLAFAQNRSRASPGPQKHSGLRAESLSGVPWALFLSKNKAFSAPWASKTLWPPYRMALGRPLGAFFK